jgi:hypothetical protein
LPHFDNRPDFLDSRFAAPSHLVDDLFNRFDADSLICNR